MHGLKYRFSHEGESGGSSFLIYGCKEVRPLKPHKNIARWLRLLILSEWLRVLSVTSLEGFGAGRSEELWHFSHLTLRDFISSYFVKSSTFYQWEYHYSTFIASAGKDTCAREILPLHNQTRHFNPKYTHHAPWLHKRASLLHASWVGARVWPIYLGVG